MVMKMTRFLLVFHVAFLVTILINVIQLEGKVTHINEPCPDGRKQQDTWQDSDKCEMCVCVDEGSHYECHTCPWDPTEGYGENLNTPASEYPKCCSQPISPEKEDQNNCGLGRKINDVWKEPVCSQCTCHASGVHCQGCTPMQGDPDKIKVQDETLDFPDCCPYLVDAPFVELQGGPNEGHPRIHINCQSDKPMTGRNWTETGCLGCYCDKTGAVCLGCPIVETHDMDFQPDPSLDFPHCCPKPTE